MPRQPGLRRYIMLPSNICSRQSVFQCMAEIVQAAIMRGLTAVRRGADT